MKEYVVGINKECIITAESEEDAISIFMDSISWKDCYVSEEESDNNDIR